MQEPPSSFPESTQSSGKDDRRLVKCTVMWTDICREVGDEHAELFSLEEFTWLWLYLRQSTLAQQVFCALLSLPNDWHRMDAVKHEVALDPDLEDPAKELRLAFRHLSELRLVQPPSDTPLSQRVPPDGKVKEEPSEPPLPLPGSQPRRRAPPTSTNSAALPISDDVKLEDIDLLNCTSLALGLRHTARKTKLEALTTEQLKEVSRRFLGKRKIRSRQQMIDDLEKTSKQPTLHFALKDAAKPATQFDKMMKVVDTLVDDVPCIKIKPEVYEFFRLINVLYYRRTTFPDFSRPENALHSYDIAAQTEFRTRDPRIWPTRQVLDLYYETLALRARVEGKLPWPIAELPTLQPKSCKPRFSARFLKQNDAEPCHTAAQHKAVLAREAMQQVRSALESLALAPEPANDEVYLGLRRFERGYTLTRVLWAGAQALANSRSDKDKSLAIELYEDVLQQRRWCLGDSGAMYAGFVKLLLNVADKAPKDEAAELRVRTFGIVDTALGNHYVGFTYRPRLQRLTSANPKPLNIKPEIIRLVKEVADVEDSCASQRPRGRYGALHLWTGADGLGEPGSALEYVQKHYDARDCTTLSNRNVLTSIFALLFWDILWDEGIHGAFEHPFQDGPLDLTEPGVFLCSREEQICAQLKAIRQGHGPEMVRERLEGDLSRQTVGFDWEMDRGVLKEVVETMKPEVLVTICTLFCEDYAARRDSVPDLIAYDDEKVKFVYVTDGKALTSAQQVWIDTLSSVNAKVEYCKILEQPVSPRKPMKKRKKPTPNVNLISDDEADEDEDESGSAYESSQENVVGPSSQQRRGHYPRVAKKRRSEEDV
ncbi:hypothetical protein HDZ31DRAFT_64171 [Schizophyllum fasciatum]